MAIASLITLQQIFRFDGAVADRLRLRQINVKEAFTVRDGAGSYYRAALKELTPNGGAALPYESMERSPEPTIEITLACCVLARQRMNFVMQKATELGVMRIVPLLSAHSVPREGLEHEQASAWPAQITRAARQCRRGSLPHLLLPATLDEFLNSSASKSANVRVLLDDRAPRQPTLASSPTKVVLLTGPEGGFSDPERERLSGEAHPWLLGGRILRAETAIVVGLTAVQMRWGDFKIT